MQVSGEIIDAAKLPVSPQRLATLRKVLHAINDLSAPHEHGYALATWQTLGDAIGMHSGTAKQAVNELSHNFAVVAKAPAHVINRNPEFASLKLPGAQCNAFSIEWERLRLYAENRYVAPPPPPGLKEGEHWDGSRIILDAPLTATDAKGRSFEAGEFMSYALEMVCLFDNELVARRDVSHLSQSAMEEMVSVLGKAMCALIAADNYFNPPQRGGSDCNYEP